jgi:LacI family transcriptional regulator
MFPDMIDQRRKWSSRVNGAKSAPATDSAGGRTTTLVLASRGSICDRLILIRFAIGILPISQRGFSNSADVNRAMGKIPKIALLIDTSTTWGSGIIQGVADYVRAHDDWQVHVAPWGRYERITLPAHWTGDGVIARVVYPELADQLVARKIPTVNVSWYRHGEGRIPQCTVDESLVAEMAAEFFIERGFRQFAYCGSSLRPNYEDQLEGPFTAYLRSKAFNCHCLAPKAGHGGYLPSEADQIHLTPWLRELPKPIGLLAFDSLQARQVVEACQLGKIEVPHEVAVLGGEHDLLSCTISNPQLSSVDQSPRRVGWTAAELLAKLVAGEPVPKPRVLLPPARIITRQSTDVVAVDDDMLALAIRFIHQHSHERIQVEDILAATPISRRALEMGFRKCLGRSPAEAICRARVDHAVQLLCDTSWAMPRIAAACGFERPELLTRAFRRELSVTPTEFRRQYLTGRLDADLTPD